jgi:hypothetical protein
VAYFSAHGSTKAERIVQFLKEVLDACQNAGLHVVATACDMGTKNVKALKLMGVSDMEPFSSFITKKLQQFFILLTF